MGGLRIPSEGLFNLDKGGSECYNTSMRTFSEYVLITNLMILVIFLQKKVFQVSFFRVLRNFDFQHSSKLNLTAKAG